MGRKLGLALIIGVLLMASFASARMECTQDQMASKRARCFPPSDPVPILEQDKVNEPAHHSSYDGTSTKKHWVMFEKKDCYEKAWYETYQVGSVCEGKSKCNVKTYYDRIRSSRITCEKE